jgi:hypothetical protein
MPQIGSQKRQLRPHIGTRTVPANQRSDRTTVPKIVNSWPPAGSRANIAGIQEDPQTALQSPCCIGLSSMSSMPDNGRGGKDGKIMLTPHLQVMLKLANYILW